MIKNPLRILDSKYKTHKEIISNAPKISDYYIKESSYFFDQVLNELQALGIPYTVDRKLVLIGREAGEHALTLANKLHSNGLYVVYEHCGALKTRMKKANQVNAKVVLIFGDEELSRTTLKIKNMDTSEEKMIARVKIVKNIKLEAIGVLAIEENSSVQEFFITFNIS